MATPLIKLSQAEFEQMLYQNLVYICTSESQRKTPMGKKACFRDYDLSDIDFQRNEVRSLTDIDFSYTVLSNLDFSGVTFVRCDFTYAIANQTNFHRATFINCKFPDMHSADSDFTYAVLHGTQGKNAVFVNVDFSCCQGTGLYMPNATFDRCTFINSKLHEGNFTSASFALSNLHCAELDNGIFLHTNFAQANLSEASCYGSNFNCANLSKTNLYLTDMSYANLSKASTQSAFISGCIFRGNQLDDPPLSIGPMNRQNDFLTYNPQDNMVSMNLAAYHKNFPPLRFDGKPPFDAKKFRPILLKECKALAKSDKFLAAALAIIETRNRQQQIHR